MQHRKGGLASRAGTTALVACIAAAAFSAPSRAQTAPPPASEPGLLEKLGIKGRVPPAPDFVTSTRRSDVGYIPVGRRGAARPTPVMNAAELASVTSGLDADRMRQQRRAGLKPPTVPVKVVKPKSPKPPKAPKPFTESGR